MIVDDFKKLPVLGILRGAGMDSIEPLVETAIEAGLATMEITMNTPGASGLLARAIEVASGRLTIGAGTVLDRDDLDSALAAGATFIVMPTLVLEVVSECRRHGIPVFPGALTPQEIFDAHRAGATMVKVFPAKFFGPTYFKEIKGPFGNIELLACGGVDAANLADFFANGASAVAFGGSIFQKKWIVDGHYDRIGEAIRGLLDAYRSSPAAS